MSNDDKTSYSLFVLYDSLAGRCLQVRSMDMQDGGIYYDPHPDDFIPFNEQEITDEDGVDRDTICQAHNSTELQRAKDLLKTVKQTLKTIPASDEYKNQKDFLENIIGIYLSWFAKNEIDPINTRGSSNLDADKPKNKTRPKDPKLGARKLRLSKRYYELHFIEGLKKDKCLKILHEEFPPWSRSTIETYLKK